MSSNPEPLDKRTRLLRSASTVLVMCGWSLVLLTPVASWLGCGPLMQNGFDAMCGNLFPPTVYFYVGAIVVVMGTLLHAAFSLGISDFASLSFAGIGGGFCLCVLSFMAQSLYIPWAIAPVVVVIAAPALLLARRL